MSKQIYKLDGIEVYDLNGKTYYAETNDLVIPYENGILPPKRMTRKTVMVPATSDYEGYSEIGQGSDEFTPEYRELYNLGNTYNDKIREYYESKGRTDLAQWAAANPTLAAKEILKGSGQFMAQELLEKRRNEVIKGEFSTASNKQVPNFDPDSANLNFDSDQSYDSTKYDPRYVDFSRNNTVPKAVFSVMEQLGI